MSIGGQRAKKGEKEKERERERDYYFTGCNLSLDAWQSRLQVKPADRDWQLSRCGNSPTPRRRAHHRAHVPPPHSEEAPRSRSTPIQLTLPLRSIAIPANSRKYGCPNRHYDVPPRTPISFLPIRVYFTVTTSIRDTSYVKRAANSTFNRSNDQILYQEN